MPVDGNGENLDDNSEEVDGPEGGESFGLIRDGRDGEVDDSLVAACEWASSCSCVTIGVFGPPEFSLVLRADDCAVAVAAKTSN